MMNVGPIVGEPKRGGKSASAGYNYIYNTGQLTSYRTGDDEWVSENIFQPVLPTSKTWVNPIDPDDFTKVQFTNPFGTLDRFVEETTNYITDCHTGLMWYNQTQTADTWNNSIDASLGTDYGGSNSQGDYRDWFMPNRKQLDSLVDLSLGNTLSYSPISIGSINMWTSTTAEASTVAYIMATFRAGYSGQLKTGSFAYIFCRKRF